MRILAMLLSLILMIFSGWFFYNYPNDCCGGTAEATGLESSMPDSTDDDDDDANSAGLNAADNRMSGYMMFNWDKDEPVLRDDWETRKNEIVNGLKEGELLEITGLYRSDEVNNSSYENLGIARAHRVKALISPPIDGDRITLNGELVDDGADKDGLFTSARFRNYVKTQNLDTSIPDKTIIRFPFNSDQKLNDSDVEAYLDQLAERVKSSGERVQLTGHTDNIGSIESNITLGNRRANIIKRYLISKGVAASKILTDSKGEASPIASNSSSAGRAENRRTELQIIQ